MGEMVEFASNGGQCGGYLALPAAAQAPAVVVIQEWWGLVPHIKELADRFAQAGFVALAPDLYHGTATKSPDEAGKLMMSLRIDEAEKDLRGAVTYLLGHPRVQGTRVGTVGFCMGGALSLFAACRNPEVGACVIFYGGHPNVKPDLAQLQAPVLGLYAGKDGFVTPEVVRELGAQLTALGKRHTLHTYPEAQHAFFNDTRPEVYDAAAAEDAWTRTVQFFRRELKG
ncbi:MAG: dienelactone hydrolase family protein [Acidobacteriota bacterium]|nr:dienelactone hydrolase family protein [Acidobacteriota bacterium]